MSNTPDPLEVIAVVTFEDGTENLAGSAHIWRHSGEEWLVHVWTRLQAGAADTIALSIWPHDGRAGLAASLDLLAEHERLSKLASSRGALPALSATQLQQVPLRELLASRANDPNFGKGLPDDAALSIVWPKTPEGLGVHRDDIHLSSADWAARTLLAPALIFAHAVRLGSPQPVHIVAQKLGKSVNTASGLISKARLAGLLTEGTPGRATGELTEKAEHLTAAMRIIASIRERESSSESESSDHA